MAGKRRESTFQRLLDEGLLEIGDGYRAQNDELGGTGPIFLRAGHVTDTHIDFTGVEHFHEHLAAKVRSKMSKIGDTIVTTKGNSTGRTSFVTDRLPSFVYSPHLSYWRSRNPEKLCGGFLRYWSQGVEFVEQLSGMKASTDMAPYLSLTDQRRLAITLPTLAEQRAIASVLGALDDKIELNRRMNATLEAMARTQFVDWIQAHANELLERVVQELIDVRVLLVGDGYRAKSSEFADDGLPFVRAGDLKLDGLDLTGAEVLSARSTVAAGHKVAMPDDVAFTSKGTVGRITRVSVKTGAFVYSPQVCFWRSLDHDNLNPNVLYRWMSSEDFTRQVAAVSTQTDMAPYVSLQDQRKMVVQLPSATAQRQIARQLEPIDA